MAVQVLPGTREHSPSLPPVRLDPPPGRNLRPGYLDQRAGSGRRAGSRVVHLLMGVFERPRTVAGPQARPVRPRPEGAPRTLRGDPGSRSGGGPQHRGFRRLTCAWAASEHHRSRGTRAWFNQGTRLPDRRLSTNPPAVRLPGSPRPGGKAAGVPGQRARVITGSRRWSCSVTGGPFGRGKKLWGAANRSGKPAVAAGLDEVPTGWSSPAGQQEGVLPEVAGLVPP